MTFKIIFRSKFWLSGSCRKLVARICFALKSHPQSCKSVLQVITSCIPCSLNNWKKKKQFSSICWVPTIKLHIQVKKGGVWNLHESIYVTSGLPLYAILLIFFFTLWTFNNTILFFFKKTIQSETKKWYCSLVIFFNNNGITTPV